MENLAISDPLPVRSEIDDTDIETGYETLVHTNADGARELSVSVSGVTCAACIHKIESALKQEPDVDGVYLNFTTGQLRVNWHGEKNLSNAYVNKIENLGYGVRPFDTQTQEDDQKKEERFLLLCLGVAGFAMGNIMLLSVGVWTTTADTMGMATRDLLHWISAIIALPTILFSGRPFFRSAIKVLSNGQTNMDVPISLAILLASGMSVFEVMNHGEHVYFDSAVMLTFFLLIGRFLDFKARQSARSSAHDLLSSLQGFASVIEGGAVKRVLIRDLKEEMVVQVAAGETIPADGEVIDGHTTIDNSLITGETLPNDVKHGDHLYAGTLNLSSPVTMRVTKAADDTLLSDIARLMDQAGQSQAVYVRIADKAARLYTPVVHLLALLAFLGWFFVAGVAWQDALLIAVTVLIITCPCALGLAVPVVQVLSVAKLMKKGVFVKSGDALERLSAVDAVIFDKTGTLTLGRLALVGEYDPALLKLAASLAVSSAHPCSKAIVSAYEGALLKLENTQEFEGQGVSAEFEGKPVKLGSRSWCGDVDAPGSDDIEIWLNVDGEAVLCLHLKDTLREDAAETVGFFKASMIEPYLCSGDRKAVVEQIAQNTGIEKFYAEQTPPEKYSFIEQLQNKGRKVLMVGDGLNDAPSLSKADVSIAPGTAIDLTQQTADIVFMGDKLAAVLHVYALSKKTQSLVKQNFALAVFYNAVAIPLALLGLVTPLIAALAMSGSSLLVIANSFRVKLSP
jgi:Cu2+-exporting ATPase